MSIIKDEVKIENKGDLFLIHRASTEMINSQQFLQIHEALAKKKAELAVLDKDFKAFDDSKKLAQEVFMKEIKAKQTQAKAKKVSEGLEIKK